MNRTAMIVAALGAVGLLMLWSRSAYAASEDYPEDFSVIDYNPDVGYPTTVDYDMSETTFSVDVPEQYSDAILTAAAKHGVPADLLARLLWQESRFRDDIVYCNTLSSAGAMGIAQFMPATARDVSSRIGAFDPCEPFGAINASAYYLSTLYNQTGNWLDAVAAYNWGIGNVKKHRAGTGNPVPQETVDYTAAIVGQSYA
jgi:soluble lytic murein transglycosylase-like protein